MARLNRFLQRIFGSTAQSQELGRFGSLAEGTVQYATNPDQVQELDRYLRGWFGGVVGNNSPAIQDVNGLFYMLTYQIAYIMQRGIPEWNSETTYYTGSICATPAGVVYRSLTNNNQNVAVTDDTNWEEVFSSTASTPADGLTQDQINDFLTNFQISGSTITVTNQGGDTTTFMLAGDGTSTTSPADGLTQGEVNALLSGASLTDSTITFTRQNGDTFTIDIPTPDASPADGLTQNEVNNFLNNVSLSMNVLTFTSQDGSTTALTLPTPTASPADGLTQAEVNALLNDADLSGTTLTFTRQNGDTVALTIPSGTTSAADGLTESEVDNLVNNLTLSGTTLTVTRQNGNTFTITLPSSGGTTTSPADGLTETEVNNLIKGLTLSNSVLTITRQNDATSTITLPSPTTSPADGLTQTEVNALLADADLTGTTLTFTRQNGDVVTIEIPSGTTSPADGLSQTEVDNLVNNLALSDTTLTITRQGGSTFTITLPSGGTGTTSPADSLTQGEINNLLNGISLSDTTLTIERQGAADIVINNVGAGVVIDTPLGTNAEEASNTNRTISRNELAQEVNAIKGRPVAALTDAQQNTVHLGQPTFANNVLSFPIIDGDDIEINIGAVELDFSGATVTPELMDRLLIGDRSLVDNPAGFSRNSADDESTTAYDYLGELSFTYASDGTNNYLISKNHSSSGRDYNIDTDSFSTVSRDDGGYCYAYNPDDSTRPIHYLFGTGGNATFYRETISGGGDISVGNAPAFIEEIINNQLVLSAIKDGIWYFVSRLNTVSVMRAMRISDLTRQESLEVDISSIPNVKGFDISNTHFLFTSSDNSNLYSSQISTLSTPSVVLTLARSYPDIAIDGSGNLWGAWNDAAGSAYRLEKYDAAAQVPVFSNAHITIQELATLLGVGNLDDTLSGQPTFNNNVLSFPTIGGTPKDINIGSVEIDLSGTPVTPEPEDRLLIGDRSLVDNPGGFSRNSGDDLQDQAFSGTTLELYYAEVEISGVEVPHFGWENGTGFGRAYNISGGNFGPTTRDNGSTAYAWNPDEGNDSRDIYHYNNGVLRKYNFAGTDSLLILATSPTFVSEINPTRSIIRNSHWYFMGVDSGTPVVRVLRLSDNTRVSSLEPDISSIPNPSGFSHTSTHFLFTSSDNSNLYSSQISTLSTPSVVLTLARSYPDITIDGDGNLWGGWRDTTANAFRLEKYDATAQLPVFSNAPTTFRSFRDQVAPPLPIFDPIDSGATFPASHNPDNGDILTQGCYLRMNENKKLDSIDTYIYPESNTDTFRYVVGEVIDGTFSGVAGHGITNGRVSNEVSLTGQTITDGNRVKVNFKYQAPFELVSGTTYFFGVSRTDIDDTTNTNDHINIPLGTLSITDDSITPIFQSGISDQNVVLGNDPDTISSSIGQIDDGAVFSDGVVLQPNQNTILAFETLNFISQRESTNRRELLPSQTTLRNNTDITLNDSILNYAEISVFIRTAHASDTGKWIMLPAFVFRPSLLIQGTRQLELKVGNETVGNNNRHFWLELDEDDPTMITMITTPTGYDGDALIMSIEGRK